MLHTTPPARLGSTAFSPGKDSKGALRTYFASLVRRFAEKAEGFPPTANAVCPHRGQRQGLKNSPRSQRRSSRRPEQRKEGKAIERSVPCPDEQRRQKGAETDGRGEFPLVEWRKRKEK